MLETPNATEREIFPVFMLAAGDDGKRRPFHCVHCLAQPPCDAVLRISPGKHGRLPPECVAKFAAQKGWLADKRGYALCPEHKPGGAGRPPSDMPPGQKRAAFLAIRDRNIEAAAARMLKPAKPVGSLAKEVAAVRAKVEADKAERPAEWAEADAAFAEWIVMVDYERNTFGKPLSEKERSIFGFIVGHPHKVWKSRRDAARAGGFNVWTFQNAVEKGLAAGLFVLEPMKPPAVRPFRFRMVDKFDPPAMQPDSPEESPMSEETVVVAVQPKAEPPRQPTREDNRRIRDFLDGNFDEAAARYCGDWSDQKAAERLRVPRAWVSAIRSTLYGDDRNEADDAAAGLATELVGDAVALKDDALAIATRAEELERRCRQFLAGKAKP